MDDRRDKSKCNSLSFTIIQYCGRGRHSTRFESVPWSSPGTVLMSTSFSPEKKRRSCKSLPDPYKLKKLTVCRFRESTDLNFSSRSLLTDITGNLPTGVEQLELEFIRWHTSYLTSCWLWLSLLYRQFWKASNSRSRGIAVEFWNIVCRSNPCNRL